ncbi:hypothetical protein [Lactobacillus delbrueckii]|jgi:hypothetical protein|uniref:hypothetical protein n=1 Tax=Lactobacillus delbrueckii TaxID=1584 RepID=UPI0022223C35|nr:hypothetical protein [Lactobacillus delbrueckii]UYX13707.1 hypothetical protein OJ966_05025 [Lactobacillus delbrueckii]
MDLPTIKQSLADAGCRQKLTTEILRMYESGQYDDALRKMKLARCQAMCELRKCSRKVELLDFLIGRAEKEKIGQ